MLTNTVSLAIPKRERDSSACLYGKIAIVVTLGQRVGWRSARDPLRCASLAQGRLSLRLKNDSARDDAQMLGKTKRQRAEARCPLRLIPSPGIRQIETYWLSGLKVRIVASAAEQAPAGSTRTTASSSAQNARMPVWLIDSGIATTV
jgi:hypothetical protein